MALCSWLESRRNGINKALAEQVSIMRMLTLEPSKTKRLMNEEYIGSWTSCLDIESVEQRYLLTGLTDGRMVIYDLESSSLSLPRLSRPIATAPSPTETDATSPKGCTSALEWYACDTGMFMSAHMDGLLRFWDTNRMSIILKFDFNRTLEALTCASLSPTARHSLAAVARSGESFVRLVDYRTRAATQTLARNGHSRPVRTVRWHPVNEHVLVSGGSDGRCLAWDVRSSIGPFTRFEVQETQTAKQKARSHSGNSANAVAKAHNAPVCGAQFSSRGDYLVTLSSGAGARLWSVQSGRNLANFEVYHALQSGSLRFAILDAGRAIRMRLSAGPHATRSRTRTRWRPQFLVDGSCRRRRRVSSSSSSSSDSDEADKPKARARLVKRAEKADDEIEGLCTPQRAEIDSFLCRSVVALPNESRVELFDLHSATRLATLRGHLDALRCIVSRANYQELYSAAVDHQVTCWSPAMDSDVIRQMQADEEDRSAEAGIKRRRVAQPVTVTQSVYADNWSDSD